MKRILFLMVATITLTACGSINSKKRATTKTEIAKADITEVLYFHGKQRCITCNAIEKLTKEVLIVRSMKRMLMLVKIANNTRKHFNL